MTRTLQSFASLVHVPIVRVQIDSEKPFVGILTEIGATSVTFDFPRLRAPQIEVGQVRSMIVGADRLGSNVKLNGRVRARWEDVDRIGYRLEVGNDDLTALAILVERRGTTRVEPAGHLRSLLLSLEGARRVEASVEDISRTGVRLFVSTEQAAQVVDLEAMTICLLLPGDGDTLELVGILRNREQRPEGVRLGFEFVARGACEFVRQLERIECFVLARQADRLRQLVEEEEENERAAAAALRGRSDLRSR